MTRSAWSQFLVLGAFLLLPGVVPRSVHAQRTEPRAEDVATARAFLSAANPRLGPGLMVKLVPTPVAAGNFGYRRFALFVNEREIEPSYSVDILLASEFTFGETGRIETYLGHGRLLRAADNSAFEKTVGQHPEWSPERIGEELKRVGARFGPNQGEALLAWLEIRGLEPMLGELTLLDASFEILRDAVSHQPIGTIGWKFQFQSSTGLNVFLDAEPFDGVITSVLTGRPH